VTRSKHEAVEGAHRQHKKNVAVLRDEVKELRKLTTDQLTTANLRHRDAMAKLEEQKDELRERVKAQRAEYKERVACVASRNEALERLCTVSKVKSKKLGGELASEQLKSAACGANEFFLAERVHNLATENEQFRETLEMKQEADKELRKEMEKMRTELVVKCAELHELNVRFTNWKESEREFTRKTQAKTKALRNKRDKLMKVQILSITLLSNYFPLIMSFAFCVSSR
jgi:hypothetical protein